MISKNTVCRDCGSQELVQFIDLSDQPPANAFITKEQITKEKHYPLKAYVCADCQLVQLTDIVDLDELFQNYVYFSAGAGPTLPKHFSDYADMVVERFHLGKDSFVIELGSNDGLLLSAFQRHGIKVVGVDPAHNVTKVANERGVPTIAEPWSEQIARTIVKEHGKADVIIGNNVVAHINDHQGLVKGVKAALKPTGSFIFEAPYLVDMFENLTFDTIYHEHLACLSLRPLKKMFESHGLAVFDMIIRNVQGVSLRVFVGFPDAHEVSPRVRYFVNRSEERRVGKECRSRWSPYH